MHTLLLHLGYPRAASTTIQKTLKLNKNFVYIDFTEEPWSEINHDIIYAREGHIRRNIDMYVRLIEEYLGQLEDDSTIVFSNESLLSYGMMLRERPRPYVWSVAPFPVIRNLARIFTMVSSITNIKVILCVRSQQTLFSSFYQQVYGLSFYKHALFSTYKRFVKYSLDEHRYGFIADSLHYKDVIDEIKKSFHGCNYSFHFFVYEELLERDTLQKMARRFAKITAINESLIEKCLVDPTNQSTPHKATQRNLLDRLSSFHARHNGNRGLNLRKKKWLINLLRKIKLPRNNPRSLDTCARTDLLIKKEFEGSNDRLREDFVKAGIALSLLDKYYL